MERSTKFSPFLVTPRCCLRVAAHGSLVRASFQQIAAAIRTDHFYRNSAFGQTHHVSVRTGVHVGESIHQGVHCLYATQTRTGDPKTVRWPLT